jgi:hypothetical protein
VRGGELSMLSVKEYEKHLFNETTDGYIQLIKFDNDKIFKIYSTNIQGLREVVEETEGQKDTYISPNTMYKPFRRVENIRQFRALYIDIDGVEGDQIGCSYRILELAEKKEIPKPTMIVNSGRGIHVYWRIVNAPYGALQTWQELEDYLYYKLKHLGADMAATDGARILRLPGTINSKNNSICRALLIDDSIEYSMYDLREEYLNYKNRGKQLEFVEAKKSTNNKVIANSFFNSYSLHMTRSNDILLLCKLRNYDVKGYRNMILHCFAYWKGIYIRDEEELAKEVIDLNNSFKEPLRETQVNAILRCIPKAIDRFIVYEQGVRSGERKRVTKGMRDKEGYWYKNETLIERLDITEYEQSKLKTIIGTQEKYKRNNNKRTAKRRNEDGLTQREQQKQDTIKNIQELKDQGLSQSKVSKQLGKGIATVKRYWNV